MDQTPSKLLLIVCIIIGLATISNVVVSSINYTAHLKLIEQQSSPSVSYPLTCSGNSISVQYTPFYGSKKNDTIRFSGATGNVIIRNVTVWTVNAENSILVNHDVIIQDGIITKIGPNPQPTPPGFIGITVDGQGRDLTPGLVDIHSHAGAHGFPESFGNSDSNELPTVPNTPQVRAVDALNPHDPAIKLIMSGGITTSLILPGSGNVMGGEAAFVKMRGETVNRLLIPNAPRALKMACGENPKRVYGSLNVSPATRMGVGWEFRRKFYQAAVLKAQQQQWACRQTNGDTIPDLYPQDLEIEALVAVLSGQVKLMVHCYKVEDMEMVIRTSKEFNFSITAFHHALEAWMIPDELRENNIAVATWPDYRGFKMEAYFGSVHAVTKLVQNGVSTVLKTDHPVIYARYFIYEAAKAYHWGLTPEQAIRAVTATPAQAAGLDQRLGSVEEGKDGDVVIWDRFPLDVGATPTSVFIDGNLELSRDLPTIPRAPLPDAELTYTGPSPCISPASTSSVIRGATVHTLSPDGTIVDATIIVDNNGIITCLGTAQTCVINGDSNIYDIVGGVISPGFMNSASSTVGQLEVDQEYASADGEAPVKNGANIKAADGIRLTNYRNRYVVETLFGGVTTIIASPQGSHLVSGQSAAFYLLNNTVIDDVLISASSSLDIHLGAFISDRDVASFSSQIAQLRSYFITARANNTPELDVPFQNVLDGNIPLVVSVNQIDQINSLLRLQKEFGFKLIIFGGAEAHLSASELASAGVSVLFNPFRLSPGTFESWNIRDDSIQILYNAGVKVGLSLNEPNLVTNLRWEAAYALNQGIPYTDALAMISRNIAEMYNLDVGTIAVGKKANFVAFDGDPLTIKSNVALIVVGNTVICNPQREK